MDRVKDFGEVLTPDGVVEDMISTIQDDINDFNKKILDTGVGKGAFICAVYGKRLIECENVNKAICALQTLYGIDLLQDNVQDTRQRLKSMLIQRFPNTYVPYFEEIDQILAKNIIWGDYLKNTYCENGKYIYGEKL